MDDRMRRIHRALAKLNKRASGPSRRLMALLLCFCMIAPLFMTGAIYADDSDREESIGLCEHHPRHTGSCGYDETIKVRPCTHEHDGTCGYVPELEHSCKHLHDDDCGYVQACEFICEICNPMAKKDEAEKSAPAVGEEPEDAEEVPDENTPEDGEDAEAPLDENTPEEGEESEKKGGFLEGLWDALGGLFGGGDKDVGGDENTDEEYNNGE